MKNQIQKTCRECSAEFTITEKQSAFYEKEGYKEPTRCPECRQKKRQTESMNCKDCGQFFTLNGLEIEYYEKQGMQIPKRCPACRTKRREAGKK